MHEKPDIKEKIVSISRNSNIKMINSLNDRRKTEQKLNYESL